MANSASAAVLYCQGTFDIGNPTSAQLTEMKARAASINTSGFTAVILGQWHVHADGTVYYNNTLSTEVTASLAEIIPALMASGGSVKQVLISFGPFYSDFTHIAANQSKVQAVITAMQGAGITGVDWDLEQEWPESQIKLLTTMTEWATGKGLIVTAAPYEAQSSFWNPLLKATNGAGKTGFSWWNLQLYGGADYGQWVEGLGKLVPDPQSFLVPGWNIGGDPSPSDLQSNVSSLKQSYSGLSGAFIWRYEDVNSSGNPIADYASAIKKGLSAS